MIVNEEHELEIIHSGNHYSVIDLSNNRKEIATYDTHREAEDDLDNLYNELNNKSVPKKDRKSAVYTRRDNYTGKAYIVRIGKSYLVGCKRMMYSKELKYAQLWFDKDSAKTKASMFSNPYKGVVEEVAVVNGVIQNNMKEV